MGDCDGEKMVAIFIGSSYLVRKLIPLVSYRSHRKLMRWVAEKFRTTDRGRDAMMAHPTPNDVFMFTHSDIVPSRLGCQSILSQMHCEAGLIIQEARGMVFCFIGIEHIPEVATFCLREKVYPPLVAQILEYLYDNGPTGGVLVANYMHMKHFSNWFYFHGDRLDIPMGAGDKPSTVLSCNPIENGVMWFSETQMDMHVTLLTLSVIDYMLHPPVDDTRHDGAYSKAFGYLNEKVHCASDATLYMYVKYIMETKITHVEREGHNGIHQDYFYDTLADMNGCRNLEEDHFASRLHQHTGGWPSIPMNYPLSAVPLIPPKSYLSDIQVATAGEEDMDLLGDLINPYTLPALQVTEVVRWLVKVCFQHHLNDNMNPFILYEKRGMYPDAKKICESLSCHVKLGMSQHVFKKLYDSAVLIFSLPRGRLTHLFRLFMGSSVQVVDMPPPHCPSNDKLDAYQVPSKKNKCVWASETVLEGSVFLPLEKRQYRQTDGSRPSPKVLSVGKVITQKGHRIKFDTLFVARLHIPPPMYPVETRVGYVHCDPSREIYVDMMATHFSMNDILTTLSFYQLRLPFLPRSTVAITYDSPGICTIQLPEGGKERIQKYIPVWMHYMQLAPQRTIMAPLLFHNYLHALQTNDIAGILSVAESISNLISGTTESIPICACDPPTGCWDCEPGTVPSEEQTTTGHSASVVSDAFVTHMGTLAILIGSIDYHMAIETLYADSRNFVSTETLSRLNECQKGGSKERVDEPRIRSVEAIWQLTPHLANIYSAMRAFIHVNESHLISYRVLNTIVSRFRNSIDNSIRFPNQAQAIGYLVLLSENASNTFYVRETGGKYLHVPAYYPSSESGSAGIDADYDVVPFIIHFYPLIYISTSGYAEPSEVMDFFFGIRLYREMADYLYQVGQSKTAMSMGEGNRIPPTFTHTMSDMEDPFYTYIHTDTPSSPHHHNPVTDTYRAFYHFLYYTELLSHIPCQGVVPDDIRSARTVSEKEYLSGGKMDISYRGITNIDIALAIHIRDMTPFDVFTKYPPEDDIWKAATGAFHEKWTVDPMAYNSFFGSDLDGEDDGISGELPEWRARFSRDASQKGNKKGELFPFLSIYTPHADPTNTTNESSPLFGADPFIPFALSFAPITHMGVAGLIIDM